MVRFGLRCLDFVVCLFVCLFALRDLCPCDCIESCRKRNFKSDNTMDNLNVTQTTILSRGKK